MFGLCTDIKYYTRIGCENSLIAGWDKRLLQDFSLSFVHKFTRVYTVFSRTTDFLHFSSSRCSLSIFIFFVHSYFIITIIVTITIIIVALLCTWEWANVVTVSLLGDATYALMLGVIVLFTKSQHQLGLCSHSVLTYCLLCVYCLQAHRICEQLHNTNLNDLRGKTIGKV